MLAVKVGSRDPHPSPYRWYIYDDRKPVIWVKSSDQTFQLRAAAIKAGQRALAEMEKSYA